MLSTKASTIRLRLRTKYGREQRLDRSGTRLTTRMLIIAASAVCPHSETRQGQVRLVLEERTADLMGGERKRSQVGDRRTALWRMPSAAAPPSTREGCAPPRLDVRNPTGLGDPSPLKAHSVAKVRRSGAVVTAIVGQPSAAACGSTAQRSLDSGHGSRNTCPWDWSCAKARPCICRVVRIEETSRRGCVGSGTKPRC